MQPIVQNGGSTIAWLTTDLPQQCHFEGHLVCSAEFCSTHTLGSNSKWTRFLCRTERWFHQMHFWHSRPCVVTARHMCNYILSTLEHLRSHLRLCHSLAPWTRHDGWQNFCTFWSWLSWMHTQMHHNRTCCTTKPHAAKIVYCANFIAIANHSPTDATWNDFLPYCHLIEYQKVTPRIAISAITALNLHLWYLTAEMVPLALFSSRVAANEL